MVRSSSWPTIEPKDLMPVPSPPNDRSDRARKIRAGVKLLPNAPIMGQVLVVEGDAQIIEDVALSLLFGRFESIGRVGQGLSEIENHRLNHLRSVFAPPKSVLPGHPGHMITPFELGGRSGSVSLSDSTPHLDPGSRPASRGASRDDQL